jgi:ATP-dependent Clp protease ATP-binding subunit ClpA
MKTYEYPLLCQNLPSGTILGRIVGMDTELVSNDLSSLKADLAGYIEKKLRIYAFEEPEIKNAKLKRVKLEVRPHYKDDERVFPIKEPLEVEVVAVYGSNDYGYFECFFPMLGSSFYFYQEKDVEKLIKHFARDLFYSMRPEEVTRLLKTDKPWLEKLKVNVPKAKSGSQQVQVDYTKFKNLFSIAERLPQPRKGQGSIQSPAAWERSHLVNRLKHIMLEENANVLLVGKSGVGKSAIIREAIRELHSKQKSQLPFERNSFWRSAPVRLTAKAKYLGEWQMICEQIVSELEGANGFLWLENFVTLVTIGGSGPEDSIAAFLLPFIRAGQLKLIGEMTVEQLEAMRRLLPGFAEHFKIISVKEMDEATSLKVFDLFNNHIKRIANIAFDRDALELSYVLLDRFMRYDSFPGKAIRFLSQCANAAVLEEHTSIDKNFVINTFTGQTGIPDFLLRDELPLNGEELKAFFLEKIKGQDHVIDKVCSIIKVFKAGLNDPEKPISTLLFAGPTGVGKTATAKALSSYFFGQGQATQPLIRLDMSEFQHPAQIYRLIGSDGKLVRQVREKPFSVVLLDEIEKAHPQIFDALLTVLDEGMLIDDTGRLTDFRNTIIIMTSNLGSKRGSSLGFRNYQGEDYEGDIRSFFRPEFFNRIDMCLVFRPLEGETIQKIAKLELENIAYRDGIRQRKLKLLFSEQLIAYVAQKGFDPKYGARPLQREVERLIIAPMARMLVERPELQGQEIMVDYDGEIVIA